MLFRSRSVLEFRSRLLDRRDAGRVPPEKAYGELLDLDPFDYTALLGMAGWREELGDLAGALAYTWSAADAQPCLWEVWLKLADLTAQQGDAGLAAALSEIGARRIRLDPANLVALRSLPHPLHIYYEEPGTGVSPVQARIEAVIEMLRARRGAEPPEVTSRLRLHRLLLELHESENVESDLVDAIVREAGPGVPLLIGFLRVYAREELLDGDEGTVENVLALLGEIGSPLALDALIEFSGLSDPVVSGPAAWAFDRVVELQTEGAGHMLFAIAPGLEGTMRLRLAERLAFWPHWKIVDRLFDLLTENIEMIPRDQRGEFFSAMAICMIVARRREGVQLARRMLRRNASLMDRDARRDCDEQIELFSDRGGSLLQTIGEAKRSEWTVYQICAGEAEWPDDEADEEDEFGEDEDDGLIDDGLIDDGLIDDDLIDGDDVPVPLQRPPAPGRNEPCWCGSGKKYKKCHLDADNSRS